MTLQSQGALPPAQRVAERVFGSIDRFIHVEAVSGAVLLVAAIAALIWANSSAAAQYEHFWHVPLSFGIGRFVVSQPLHFWVNECLMTVFFLVVGLEIRRELYDGDLATVRTAVLPLAAAAGGIVVPAALYLSLNGGEPQRDGWGIPTATDIAFAVGVLALVGSSIPRALRVFLLALAVIDDLAGVLIIALFYSDGIQVSGVIVAAAGVLLTFAFQAIGLGRAWLYVLPGTIVWLGFVESGVHPTLAGVLLGFITPVRSTRRHEPPLKVAARAVSELAQRVRVTTRGDAHAIREPLKRLRDAERELVAPVARVQMALHPWVAFLIMPLFALANAGVSLRGIDISDADSFSVTAGIVIALVAGKPIGIVLGTWLAVAFGRANLPPGLVWWHIAVAGCLGGIGFTMSIFIATLAFPQEELLSAAKLGVLVGSGIAGILGYALGRLNKPREGTTPVERQAAVTAELNVNRGSTRA